MERQRGTLPTLEVGVVEIPKNRARPTAERESTEASRPNVQKKDRVIWKPGKITRFIATHQPKTPFLVINLDIVAGNYYTLQRHMPMADIFYAVKANPAPEVLKLLTGLGASFDVASPAEIDLVLEAGASPEKISFGNTIKKETDIVYAYEHGVRLFALDSEAELLKLARSAPGAEVFCRILTTCEGADWPLSRKFGCEPAMARDLLLKARKMGLKPRGISFHVGSQQTKPEQWDIALAETAQLFASLKAVGIELDLVNIGGGLPAHYHESIAPVSAYASIITESLVRHFGANLPKVITEPGRSLVGDAGIIETEVVLVSKKSYEEDVRWVYLDIGKFGGLAETHDEAIKYRIETLGRKGQAGPVILAGPSCDSVDILYEKHKYHLPLSLQAGDKIRIHATGAYTSSYSSVGFNGFAPLKTYCI